MFGTCGANTCAISRRCYFKSNRASRGTASQSTLCRRWRLSRRLIPKRPMNQRPNILWICTDQQRWDTIGALGNREIHTPSLDRLCAEGVAFTRAYCQSPVCTPSRASFLTGLYPSATHANRNGIEHFPASERVRLIPQRLAEVGYDCGLVGKLHLASPWRGEEPRVADGYRFWRYSHSPLRLQEGKNQYHTWLHEHGMTLDEIFEAGAADACARYRSTCPLELHQSTWCAEMAIEFMREKRAAPWLLSVNPFDPHPPFDAPEACRRRYPPGALPPPLFRESDLRNQERLHAAFFQQEPRRPDAQEQENKAAYYGMIELLDQQVGRMLAALEATGQRDNTIVVFMSDHGEMLGDHGLTLKGCRFYEGLTRVPLIISWPGKFAAGRRSDALVELADLAPTLAELAGLAPSWTHGKSLAPMLAGLAPTKRHRDFVRCEYYDALNPFAPDAPEKHTPAWGTMICDGRFKLSVYHGLEWGELYDLNSDPREFENLWEDPASRLVKERLLKQSFDATVMAGDPGPRLVGYF